ncbi:hypothetical protein DSL92_04015 [Billgrantia gudaonensis]|uniref:Diguanylate cyclase n=1 Tax=Billgrantia gudaonensis TaxID=376427 RepID=A0A3S0VSZ4_9GAMM|nr:hypothetical protein DSL92_04015 [Halomonas gudaonensis]
MTLTATLGVASHVPGETPRAARRAHDRALYRGKRAGRNRVVLDRPAMRRIRYRRERTHCPVYEIGPSRVAGRGHRPIH